MVTRGDPFYDTPRAGTLWQGWTPADRVAAVSGALAEQGWGGMFYCLSADKGGTVTLELADDLHSAERGKALRTVEANLRATVEPHIEIWLQPKVDKNAVRVKLRGVLNLDL